MRTLSCCVALVVALSVPAVAFAQEAAPAAAVTAKSGTILKTSDGKRVGRIERVVSKDGAPVSVAIIYDSRFVYVPYSTLSASDSGLVTSLSRADLRKLK